MTSMRRLYLIRRSLLCATLGFGLGLGHLSVALAQAWPQRPVKIILPGPAGSTPDIVMRLVGEKLGEIWHQQVLIDNRAGAGGNIGTAAAARVPADGYTLLFGQSAPLALNLYTYKTLPFDPQADFVAITSMGTSPMMIAVNSSTPAKTLGELIELARAQPGKINFATSNSKNIAHISGELIAKQAGVKLVHIPYQSNALAASETIAGLSQVYIDGIPPMAPHMSSGRLRVIAVTSPARLPNFPQIPAVSETLPGYAFQGWFTLMAPAGTPKELVEKISADVNRVVKEPAIASRLYEIGVYAPGGSPAETEAFIRSQRNVFRTAVESAHIEAE